MKQFLSFAVLILAAGPLLAQSHASERPAPISGAPATIADMVAGSAAGRPLSIAAGFGPDSEILLPVVINTAGLNGTFFKTDGFFANFRDVNQEVLVRFIPQGVSAAAPLRLALSGLTNVAAADLLGSESPLNRTGVGAILITAVLPLSDIVDTSAKLLGLFRIWTPQPGSAGTTSFGAWGPPSDNIHGLNGAIAIGLRQNAAFRTNVGIVNLDPVNTRSWAVSFRSGGTPVTQTITLLPLSMQLVAVPAITPSPNGYLSVTFVPFTTPGTDFRWSAFGVTADNLTGDSWLSLATQSAILPVNTIAD